MDGKVDDEDTQEVLREAALLLDLNRQQWAKAIKWLVTIQKQLAIVKVPPPVKDTSLSRHVKFGIPLSHVPWFQILLDQYWNEQTSQGVNIPVCFYVNAKGDWNLEKIVLDLPMNVVETIKTLKPPCMGGKTNYLE
ncbi:hypothetical protein JHK82_044559 [Glycine max]|nr:hypothetical protein JHK82_044559 [Glycine max]